MIVSASRRTDIPAYYSEWFFNRLEAGEIFIRNPFNKKQISRIELNKCCCFVFWTKDAQNMLKNINLLDGYHYYFQFTLTAYGNDIEKNLRPKNEIVKTFKELSTVIGKERVVWRYDPILINPLYTKQFHYNKFRELAYELQSFTQRCVISFIDDYKETNRNKKLLSIEYLTEADMLEIANEFSIIAREFDIEIESCAEKIDLSSVGICHGQCIDAKLISDITGKDFLNQKAAGIREYCNCIKSVDIGEYNSCLHGCAYCYANYNHSFIEQNYRLHNKDENLIIGKLHGDEKITDHYMMKR